jgi:hypothetical protein
MTKILVMDSAKKLNFFPAKHGISEYYSPTMILHQRNLDYTKDCKFIFGTYVQANDKPSPTNDLSAQTLDCIYLRYRDSHQGGHELLHLPTYKIIIRRNITPLPIMRKIVDKVAALADTKGMPSGLKIVSKTDTILYDLAWIAGVDAPATNTDNNANNNDAIQDNEMHLDNIAGLAIAPTRQQDNTHDQIDNENKVVHGQQDQTDNNEEIKIVFELNEEETDKEDPEEEDEPEFDRLIQTRSG